MLPQMHTNGTVRITLRRTYLPTGKERIALELAGLYYYSVTHLGISS